jgi:hypothetical protein
MREFSAPQTVLGATLYYLAYQRVAQDETDEALESLVEAFALRPDLKEAATNDPALEALHDNPAFKALVKS